MKLHRWNCAGLEWCFPKNRRAGERRGETACGGERRVLRARMEAMGSWIGGFRSGRWGGA